MNSLRYFEMPSGLELIDDFAFYYSRRLNPSEISGPNLKIIGESAFNTVCMTSSDRNMIKFGGSITTIGDNAFATNTNGYRSIQFGGPGEPSQLVSIGTNVFIKNGSYPELDWVECSIYTDDVTKPIWEQVDAVVGLTSSKIPA